MLASAVGPSSQGVWKTKWSLVERAANPQSLAASTAPSSRPRGEPLLAELHQRQMYAEIHPTIVPASQSPDHERSCTGVAAFSPLAPDGPHACPSRESRD